MLWMRVVPGVPWLAESHPSSASRREIQKMLRISSGDKSCGGPPSLGSGLACSHHTLPASPAALFSIHRLIKYYKLHPMLWCWHIPVFDHSPHVLQEWVWQLPSFGCSGCCSYRDRSGPGLGCGTDLLSDPEPSVESTFHLACTVLLMVNVMNMGLRIKPLVLDGIAILPACEECAIGHEDQA